MPLTEESEARLKKTVGRLIIIITVTFVNVIIITATSVIGSIIIVSALQCSEESEARLKTAVGQFNSTAHGFRNSLSIYMKLHFIPLHNVHYSARIEIEYNDVVKKRRKLVRNEKQKQKCTIQ